MSCLPDIIPPVPKAPGPFPGNAVSAAGKAAGAVFNALCEIKESNSDCRVYLYRIQAEKKLYMEKDNAVFRESMHEIKKNSALRKKDRVRTEKVVRTLIADKGITDKCRAEIIKRYVQHNSKVFGNFFNVCES